MPRLAAICGYLLAILALTTLTWVLWQYRFVPVADSPALTLAYTPPGVTRTVSDSLGTKDGALQLPAGAEVPRLEYQWGRLPASRNAHIALRVSCRGIEPGKMPWDDARVILMWVDGSGNMVQGHLPLWSGRGDHQSLFRDMVAPISRGGTLPKIIIENRGSAGDFTVESFQVQAVDYRPGIFAEVAATTFAWILLVGFGIRRWVAAKTIPGVRVAAAALLWVGFAWLSCLPGPWIPWQPIRQPFPISPVPAPAPVEKKSLPVVPSPPANPTTQGGPAVPAEPAIPAAPEIKPEPAPEPPPPVLAKGPPEQLEGGLVRWFFNHLAFLKRPVHLAGFSVLTTLLAFLAGSRRAFWPALALGFVSEFCQWAFGFGFDWGDVLDITLDATAACAGILLWRWIGRRGFKWPVPSWLRAQSPASNT